MSYYKCIIVDDEPRICQLINKLGNWEELNIKVISICYDGASAINEILQHRPDIVLSDIQMPIYSGLEIIEQVQTAGLHPMFIIISGYSQFEYARKAIQLKAVDYLVKPIHRDKLNDALLKCCDALALEQKQLAADEALVSAMEDLFWNDLYGKKWTVFTVEAFVKNYGMEWKIDHSHYMAAISISQKELIECQTLYMDKIFSVFAHILEKNSYFCDASNGCIYLFFSINSYSANKINTLLQRLFTDIKYLEETYGSFSVTLGCSRLISSPKELPSGLLQARSAMNYRFEKIPNAIYHYDELPGEIFPYQNLIDEAFTNHIIYAVSNLDQSTLIRSLNKFKTDFLNHENRDFNGLISYGVYLLNLVMTAERHPEHEILTEKFLFTYNFYSSYEELFQLIENYAVSIIKQKKEHAAIELSSSVKAAQNYIHEHYSEKIYLDDLARNVYLNSTYLSSIFKKELGTGITDYINTVRCNAAKELLKNTSMSLSAISEKAGYTDEKYFQHQFKKNVGITPAQFRRIYS